MPAGIPDIAANPFHACAQRLSVIFRSFQRAYITVNAYNLLCDAGVRLSLQEAGIPF
jgi:hypothetical protein